MSQLITQYLTALRAHAWGAAIPLVLAAACAFLALRGADSWGQAIQDRESKGRVVRAIDCVKTGLWQSAALNAVLLAGLGLSAPLWARRGPTERTGSGEALRPLAAPGVPPAIFWLGLALIVLLGLSLRLPRMDLSIYNDEEHTLRTYSRGSFPRMTLEKVLEHERTGEDLPFRRDGWELTIWSTTAGPNHVLFSVLSRASLTLWQDANGLPVTAFSNAVFRLPSLLAGLGLILLLGALAYRETGLAGPGWAVALLVALHPWLLRYSTEGRGYALMLLFCVLTWWFALAGLRRPTWGAWAGYGLAQWALLVSYLGAVYVPLVLNVTILAALGFQVAALAWRQRAAVLDSWEWRRLMRWGWGNALCLVLYLPMILPLLPQYRAYFSTEFASAETPDTWLRDFAAYSLAGVPGVTPTGTDLPSLIGSWREGQPMYLVAAVLVAGFALLGAALVLLRRSPLIWLLPTLALAPVVGYWHNVLGGRLLYVWYLIFVVPGILLLAAQGMAPRFWAPQALRGRAWATWVVPVLIAALIGMEGFLPKAWLLRDRPKGDLENSVRLAGRPVDPTAETRSPGSIHVACWTNNPFYDPWTITITGTEVLEEAIAYSLASGRNLELTYGHRPLIEHHFPDVLRMMEDPQLFFPATVLPGLEEKQFEVHITQLRPLDPQRITRVYQLSEGQADQLSSGLEELGFVSGDNAQLSYDPADHTLTMRNSWAEHCRLRKLLAEHP